MLEILDEVFSRRGELFRLLPARCLDWLQDDIDDMLRNDRRNPYTDDIVSRYFKAPTPAPDFEVRSVIIAASPSPLVRLFFNHGGRRVPVLLPPSYADMHTAAADIESALNVALNPVGCHVQRFFSAPHKLLAVRSGLCRYGRNSIAYCGALGSFVRLSVMRADIPCDDAAWHGISRMDSCNTCTLCLTACPTGAIDESHPQIDVNRCLTRYNEYADLEFPDFVPDTAHNCIVGCMKCQEACPHNNAVLGHVADLAEFSDTETAFILEGRSLEDASDDLTDKLKRLGLYGYYEVIPRNLGKLLPA